MDARCLFTYRLSSPKCLRMKAVLEEVKTNIEEYAEGRCCLQLLMQARRLTGLYTDVLDNVLFSPRKEVDCLLILEPFVGDLPSPGLLLPVSSGCSSPVGPLMSFLEHFYLARCCQCILASRRLIDYKLQ